MHNGETVIKVIYVSFLHNCQPEYTFHPVPVRMKQWVLSFQTPSNKNADQLNVIIT